MFHFKKTDISLHVHVFSNGVKLRQFIQIHIDTKKLLSYTEAEYTFKLRKDYIPLMMQRGYRPDGWLGFILGAKLYFDFSGKYPIEKPWNGLLKEMKGLANLHVQENPGKGKCFVHLMFALYKYVFDI